MSQQMQMQKVPASQQVQQISAQLNQALLERLVTEEKLKQLNDTITALRNVLGGVGVGQELQKEIAGEAAKVPTKE